VGEAVPTRGGGGVVASRPVPLPSPAEPWPSRREWFLEHSRAEETHRAHRADWAAWRAWASSRGAPLLPARPSDVADFASDEAITHAPATVARRLSSIAFAHRLRGLPSPVDDRVREVLRGIRRAQVVPGHGQVDALRLDDLRRLVAGLPPDLEGTRDRAMICLGWAGALRRSEVAALLVDELAETDAGLLLTISRSKTDQEGEGAVIGIPHATDPEDPACPVCAVADWIAAAGITGGPLFRAVRLGTVGREALTGWTVWRVVKTRLADAGIEGQWGGHSLRAGLVTEAALAGVDVVTIQETTRHQRMDTLVRYIRTRGDKFTRNAATMAGL
jgi:integrase